MLRLELTYFGKDFAHIRAGLGTSLEEKKPTLLGVCLCLFTGYLSGIVVDLAFA